MSTQRYWILTIPHHAYLPYLNPACNWVKGQLEEGGRTGFRHWQLVVAFKRSVRLSGVKAVFGPAAHAEPTRSEAAADYVWKDDTAIPNTRFELGKKPLKRNNKEDWGVILDSAKRGRLDDIPPDIVVRHYANLKRISADFANPVAIEREVVVGFNQSTITPFSNFFYSFRCSGVLLAQGNLEGPGTKPVSQRILKILGVNSGMDTEAKKTLSSTNFVVQSTSPTCYDG